MGVEVWFRNPYNYIRELLECGASQVAFDRGILKRRYIDPASFGNMNFPGGIDWRILCIGEQGTAEIRRGYTLEKPYAVYPTWGFGMEYAQLEEMLACPVGEDEELCNEADLSPDERPVFGQEHRVVINNIPNTKLGLTKRLLSDLRELQNEYPEAIFHIHGLYGYNVMFGLRWKSVDVDARTDSAKGRVYLPNGKPVHYREAEKYRQWVHVLGYQCKMLEEPRERCKYNIQSAMWAGEHYSQNFNFKSRRYRVEVDSSTALPALTTTKASQSRYVPATMGDKFLCDVCSLRFTCKYFRDGAVCSIPGAEPVTLARYFKTRDATQIIEGMGEVLAMTARRFEAGVAQEEEFNELDPHVSSLGRDLIKGGSTLAKLVDPSLVKPGVSVNIGGNASAVVTVGAASSQLVAAAVKELENLGVQRTQITDKIFERLLLGTSPKDIARELSIPNPDDVIEVESDSV